MFVFIKLGHCVSTVDGVDEVVSPWGFVNRNRAVIKPYQTLK